jgi:type IV pilus assembly protein PilV
VTRRRRRIPVRRRVCGTTLIEVLAALVIAAIAVLGTVGLQLRAYAADVESYQRSSALILLNDMVGRLNANRGAAASYVATGIGAGPLQDCTGAATTAAYDLCLWGNALRGQNEQVQGRSVGAMQSAQGCITSVDATTYVVAITWVGAATTGAPPVPCGAGQLGDERQRRAVSAIVRFANLG